MPKASTDGLLAYKKLLNEVRASKAPTPRPQEGADTRRPDDRDCFALHEAREIMFTAR